MRGTLLAVLLLGACQPVRIASERERRGEVDGRVFEFSSSASDDVVGRGEWTLRLRGDSAWIAWSQDGRSHEYGTFALGADQAERLWSAIVRVNVPARESSQRRGRASEVSFLFSLTDPGKPTRSVEIWDTDAKEDRELAELVQLVEHVIAGSTRKNVRF